jgi:hypothetical protein
MILLVLDCKGAIERVLVDMDATKLGPRTAQKEAEDGPNLKSTVCFWSTRDQPQPQALNGERKCQSD